MYTGIIESIGEVRAVNQLDSGCRLRIATEFDGIVPEDSVAVNGVCVTAEIVDDGSVTAYLSSETVSRTYLADLEPDDAVNVERPVASDGRFHGHVVKGTVDATMRIVAVEERGTGWWFTFEIPDGQKPYLVEKGAVALDGASLTVAAVTDRTFSVAVVPATAELTVFSGKRVGDPVHFEADILAKYAERQRTLANESTACR